ncbi:MAG: CDP-diacylglycerol--glycerol-3-phosphate 3-phosphatidyltransferase [Erysipelotrichaceae bacterium]|nr:CDP-diacylglycerol--glycerol-3-phosphate 3-phosphatidyltransferase [Erysipelotrichaceae bacterium]
MNLPNKLTLFRIFLIPVLILFWIFPFQSVGISFYEFYFKGFSLSVFNLIILFIFAIASITDALDGHIARKNNLITTFGKFADPIADKLLVNTMLLLLLSANKIPAIPVVVMLGRDTIVDGCRMIASRNGIVVAAGFMGKVKTASQMIAIALILLNNLPFAILGLNVAIFMLWFATFASLMSGIQYFMQLKDYIFESM